ESSIFVTDVDEASRSYSNVSFPSRNDSDRIYAAWNRCTVEQMYLTPGQWYASASTGLSIPPHSKVLALDPSGTTWSSAATPPIHFGNVALSPCRGFEVHYDLLPGLERTPDPQIYSTLPAVGGRSFITEL